jgi:hypothetical protein
VVSLAESHPELLSAYLPSSHQLSIAPCFTFMTTKTPVISQVERLLCACISADWERPPAMSCCRSVSYTEAAAKTLAKTANVILSEIHL